MNQIIDLNRIKYLIRKDILQICRSIPVGTAAIMGIIILKSFLEALLGDKESVKTAYNAIQTYIIIGGLILTSYAFQEMHKKEKCDDYILIPASAFEKTFTRFVLTSILLPLYIIVIVLLAKGIAGIVNALAFKFPIELYNPFNAKLGRFLLEYLIIQQIVFLGAAWFRKMHLVKTILACIVFAAVFGLPLLITGIMFIGIEGSEMGIIGYLKVLANIGEVFFYGFLAPFCWVVAWMRVREVQSHYGV